jgi:hypothetical protein
MTASGSVNSKPRYKLVGGSQKGETFGTYVEAKRTSRTAGGKVQAI